MKTILIYSHSKSDIKEAVRLVIEEIRKTEMQLELSMNIKNDRLTQKEAAKFLGISVTSLISWKKEGKVPYYQIGRLIFFSKSELLDVARKKRMK